MIIGAMAWRSRPYEDDVLMGWSERDRRMNLGVRPDAPTRGGNPPHA